MGIDYQKLASTISRLRKQKRLTQKQLGSFLGVSDKTISKWETGISIPDTFYLPMLSEKLNISIDELLTGKSINKQSKYNSLFLLLIVIEQEIIILLTINKNNFLLSISTIIHIIFLLIFLVMSFILYKKHYLSILMIVFVILLFVISIITLIIF